MQPCPGNLTECNGLGLCYAGGCICDNYKHSYDCLQCRDGRYSFPECQGNWVDLSFYCESDLNTKVDGFVLIFLECDCEMNDVTDNACNKEDGTCFCQEGYDSASGCRSCLDGYYYYPNCIECSHCNLTLTTSEVCDKDTGACLCTDSSWDHATGCSSCLPGYTGYPSCVATGKYFP